MDYTGELLWPGKLGHFFIYLSLVSSIIATLAYFFSAQSKIPEQQQSWKKLGRISFITEAFSIVAVFVLLFYIIYNHRFEYKYAWQHSSLSLELKYLLACFWEGQEGSFLLWSFWHSIIGLILIKTAKKWEAPVMSILSFSQVLLASMITGLYVFGEKIGVNPFVLLRDSGVLDNAPALHVNMDTAQPLLPDYLKFIKDGNDLNPLLQNYWMVIHPPVLFLGFAAAIVPFAYAIAGLWKKQDGFNIKADWIKPALPWALFAVALLGGGIMMGARWAYESLTFGGYWAWDPVENASLVPWLVIIAGVHTLLIYKSTGRALGATYLFFILGFLLVLYSTFLTRSGILGDTSVHSFTDLGLNVQLYLLLYTFIWGGNILTASDKTTKLVSIIASIVFLILVKSLPVTSIGFIALIVGLGLQVYIIFTQISSPKEEEQGSSREFWMFIGSLVFVLSGLIITFITSAPVINAVFGVKIAVPEDIIHFHNSIQIFIAIIIGLLTAVTQYLKYKKTTGNFFIKKIGWPAILSLLFSFLILYFGNFDYNTKGPVFMAAIWLCVAASLFAIIANIGYVWIGLKGDLKISGASVAHFGFGLVLLGILISASKKETLSNNINGMAVPLAEGENPMENLTLLKGVPSTMSKYTLTYEKDSIHPKKQQWYYHIRFKSNDGKEDFILKPDAFVNYKGNEGLMANPSAKHYLTHDVFTYITSLPNPDKMDEQAGTKTLHMKEGDTAYYTNGFIILEKLITRDSIPQAGFKPTDLATAATFKVQSKYNATYTTDKVLLLNISGQLQTYADSIPAEGLVIQVNKLEADHADVMIKDSNTIPKYLTIKAYKFPMIKLLWWGVIITVIGTFMAIWRRISENQRKSAE